MLVFNPKVANLPYAWFSSLATYEKWKECDFLVIFYDVLYVFWIFSIVHGCFYYFWTAPLENAPFPNWTCPLATGLYSLSCTQKISLVFGICPIILWYLGYLKQEETKKSCEKSFREDRLKFFPYKTSRERKARITK